MNSPEQQTAVRAEALLKQFGETRAVDGLTFEVSTGEIFGLVGPDGAGKTTTLRLLAALAAPTSGRAFVAGRDVAAQSDEVKDLLGVMGQRFGLYGDLTVRENLRFCADLRRVPKAAREEREERLLAAAGLGPFTRRRAANLSGGMRQKLALACALIHRPAVLLLDEPTNGVDPVSRRDFWRILEELPREGVTILLATSYLDEAERCDRVGLMHRGKLFAAGTPGEIRKLHRGALLELHVENPRRAAELLRAALPGARVDLFGARLHIATDDPEADAASVRTRLARENLALFSLDAIAPTLEDVFLSVLAGPEA